MYFSSSDGLRSGASGGPIREETSSCRIALVGDSFTFGEGVRFEDTWGSVLGETLGTHCQILNFGVPGYGIDQIYLRYMKDVRPWHPTIVIASFIDDDLWRTMSVYAFLKFPAAKFPFTKPRFVLDDGGRLILARRPDASLEEPFRHASIHDLPGISYDAMYAPMEWEQAGWEWVSRSYLLRSLVSLHPVFNISRPEVSKEAMLDLNSQLLLSLRREIAVDGASLLVVAMPGVEEDLKDGAAEGLGAKLLGGHKVPYTDLRVCLKAEASSDLFDPPSAGGHYSPKGNRLAARCLVEEVRGLL